jgi:hypothetical protein
MSFIDYKLIKVLYSNCYNEEKKMAKILKLVPAIILFLFLFLTIEEVACRIEIPLIQTSLKCTTGTDCPEVLIANMLFSVCFNGYCHELNFNPRKVDKRHL